MIQKTEQTHKEKVAMYKKVPKKELIEMLIQSNKMLEERSVLVKTMDLNLMRALTEPVLSKGNDYKEIKGKL